MRKLKLQVQLSLEGFVCGPNGELDWMTWNWDEELKEFVRKLTDPVDTILLGRKMADGFINHWKAVAGDKNNPEHGAGVKFHETAKVVFSRTLSSSHWENTILAGQDLSKDIGNLKAQKGGDIIVYGGAGFNTSLIAENLIDDYFLFINPTVIGKGLSIFGGLRDKRNYTLVSSRSFSCGIVVLHYRPHE